MSAAYIDVPALSSDEAAAVQTLARRLVALGYELPKHGGDTRGWKRPLLWRDQLMRGHIAEIAESAAANTVIRRASLAPITRSPSCAPHKGAILFL